MRWDSQPLVIPLISALKSRFLQSRSVWILPRNAAGKQGNWAEVSCPTHLHSPSPSAGQLRLKKRSRIEGQPGCKMGGSWGSELVVLKTGKKRSNDQFWTIVQTRKSSVVTQHPPNHANPQCSCSNSNNCNKKQLCPLFRHSWDKNSWDSISHQRGKQQQTTTANNCPVYWQVSQTPAIQQDLPLIYLWLPANEQKSST